VLDTERDTYDRNAAEKTECQMQNGYLNTPDKDPYDVHYDSETSAVVRAGSHLMSEWP
jgi:hypothetical protein